MKTNLLIPAVALAALSLVSCKTEPQAEPAEIKKTDISEFIGQWTIDIGKGGVGNVGWLEVSQAEKYLDGALLWGGGSVLPVANVFLVKDQVLMVTMTSNADRKSVV